MEITEPIEKMKNLSFKIIKWQTTILIALLLIGQNAYSIDGAKITKNECVEALSESANSGGFLGRVNSIKVKTSEFGRQLYKTRGLSLFLVDLEPDTKNFHNMMITYAPFIDSSSFFARLKNTLTLLNPFRWVGTTIKNQNYKFSPLLSLLNYKIEKLSKETLSSPKQLSGFSALLVRTAFLLTILDPSIIALNNQLANQLGEDMLREYTERIENNKEYYQDILNNDYRYAGIDEPLQQELNRMIVNLYTNFQSVEDVGIESIKHLRSIGEEYSIAYNSTTSDALIQTAFLETEYKAYAELKTADVKNFSVEKNKSQFCDLNLFQIACSLTTLEERVEGQDSIMNEAFGLTHELYDAYELIDIFARNTEIDITENLLIENARQFMEELAEFHNQGLMHPNALNYLLKRDADIQFTLAFDLMQSTLSGEFTSNEEIENAKLQARETLNSIRQATIMDITRSQR